MSPIVYAEIMKKLRSQLTAYTGTRLQWIDIEQGQLDDPEQSYPLNFPAAFIDINVAYENASNKQQVGTATINVRVAMDVPENLNNINADASFNAGIARYTLLSDIWNALENFHLPTEYFTRLTRTRSTREVRPDRLHVVNISFDCNIWEDRTPRKIYTKMNKPPVFFSGHTPQPGEEPGNPWIEIVEYQTAYSGSALYVRLKEPLIDDQTDIVAGMIIEIDTGEDISTYAGEHSVLMGLGVLECIIDVAWDDKQPKDHQHYMRLIAQDAVLPGDDLPGVNP